MKSLMITTMLDQIRILLGNISFGMLLYKCLHFINFAVINLSLFGKSNVAVSSRHSPTWLYFSLSASFVFYDCFYFSHFISSFKIKKSNNNKEKEIAFSFLRLLFCDYKNTLI